MEQLRAYTDVIVLALMGTAVILCIFVFILWIKHSRMRNNYLRLLNGSNPANMEQLLMDMQTGLNRCRQDSQVYRQQLDDIVNRLQLMKTRIGIHRYNAFAERGSDLSFSLAIVNELQDGVVLTGIHNREDTYLYAKPIERGESKYTLSPEEKEAVNRSS